MDIFPFFYCTNPGTQRESGAELALKYLLNKWINGCISLVSQNNPFKYIMIEGL